MERGRFVVTVPEDVAYVLSASTAQAAAPAVTALPSPSLTHVLTLGAGCELVGTVEGQDGTRLRGRRVLLARPLESGGSGYQILEQPSSPNGTFRLDGLAKGRFVVLALIDDAGGAVASVQAPASDLTLRDTRAEELRLEVCAARDGSPVEQATVALIGRTSFAHGVTAADGRLTLPIAPEVVRVAVRAEGFPLLQQQLTWPPATEPVVLELGAPATLQGKVLGADGEPLIGVEVAWISAEGPEAQTFTAGNGTFQLEVPASSMGMLAARAEDLVTVLPPRPRSPVRATNLLRLVPSWTQVGRVVDANRQGIGPVRVRLTDAGQDPTLEAALAWMAHGPLDAVSLADGNFVITSVSPLPRHLVLIDQEGYAPHAEELALAAGRLITVMLRPLCQLEGTVREPDGSPAIQAEVILDWPQGPLLERSESGRQWRGLRTLTDGSGHFLFPDAASGPVTLRMESPPYPAGVRHLDLLPDEHRAVEETLPRGQEVRVRVETDKGAPVPNAPLRLAGSARDGTKIDRPVTTDQVGEHRFEYLKAGLYVVFSGRTRESVQVGGDEDPPPTPITLRLPGQ